MAYNTRYFRRGLAATLLYTSVLLGTVQAQTSAFTYQGRLSDGATTASGSYQMQFRLFDAVTEGTQIGATQTYTNVVVTSGVFAVTLDFGASAFPGPDRFLEIKVRADSPDPNSAYTTLAPRQPVMATPYAIRSLAANTADIAMNASTATTAGNVTGLVAVGNGGTGSATKNFVDLSTNQNIAGNKTMSGTLMLAANGLTVGVNQLIATGNYIGIGGTNQSATITPKLYVDGSIGIPGNKDYEFANARTRKFTIGPASFVPTSSAWSARIDNGFSSNNANGFWSLSASGGIAGNQAYFVAPVQLPDGAVITGFSGILIKNGGSLNAVIDLLCADGDCYLNCTPDLIAAAGTLVNAGIAMPVQAGLITGGFEKVDNSHYHYFVRFTGEQNTQNLRLNLVQALTRFRRSISCQGSRVRFGRSPASCTIVSEPPAPASGSQSRRRPANEQSG
jgi:hypothetical protein